MKMEKKMGDNIILIGMPASGKSTVGVVLAKLLAYDFVDTDLLIQRREGLPLHAIIASHGSDGFLAIEESVCLALEAQRAVIATGGSVVYSDAAMRHLKSLGRVLYLDVDLPTLRRRLTDVQGRGVVLKDGQTVADLYDERTPLYRRYADLTVPEGDLTLEETAMAAFALCAKR